MSEQSVIKKSLFGGFNKKDVIAYIEQLQHQNVALSREIESREETIEKLSSEVNEAREKLGALTGENEELLKKAAAFDETAAQCRSELESVKAENETLKKSVEALREELGSARDEARAVAEERSSNLIKDATKYAGSIVEAAKQSAADIMLAAKEKIDSAASDITQANDRAKTAQNNLSQSMVSVKDSVDAMLGVLTELGSELTSGE